MVKNLLFFIIAIVPINAYSETKYQKFLQEIDAAQEQIDYSEGLIGHDELHTLIIERPKRTKNSTVPKIINKLSTDKNNNSTDGSIDGNKKTSLSNSPETTSNDKKSVSSGTASDTKNNSINGSIDSNKKTSLSNSLETTSNDDPSHSIYISPTLLNIGENTTESVPNAPDFKHPVPLNITFGITIGTNIEVELDASATNVQPGFIQFVTTKDIVGYKKTMRRKTRIFGRPSAVVGSSKLFVSVSSGIDPVDNNEFSLRGIIFDGEGKPGLIASIISDGQTLDRSVDAGTSALGAGMLNLVPGSLGTDAAKAAASQILNEKRSSDNAQNGRPLYILEAGPQKAIIQIERTF